MSDEQGGRRRWRRPPAPPAPDWRDAELVERAETIKRQSRRLLELVEERDELARRWEACERARMEAEQAAQLARRQAIAAEWQATLRRIGNDPSAVDATPQPVYRTPLAGTVPRDVDPVELDAKRRASRPGDTLDRDPNDREDDPAHG